MDSREKNSSIKKSIVFITGGARSGKSYFAQREALAISQNPVYVATAKVYPNDEEFKQRVERHISDRDERWTSIEEQLYPSELSLENKAVVVDCVTLWLSNFFSLHAYDVQHSLKAFQKEMDALKKINASFFIISNENYQTTGNGFFLHFTMHELAWQSKYSYGYFNQ